VSRAANGSALRSSRRALALLLLSNLSTCGGSPAAPSGPAQVAGAWTGTLTVTSITGGECVGVVLQSAVGRSTNFTASIQQSGSSLTATITDAATGTSCTYSGSAATTTISLNLQSCPVDAVLGLRCGNGDLRDIQVVAGALTGTVSGSRITGTETSTWNTFVSRTAVDTGPMVFNGQFVLNR
jgi:hypothetical protein